MAIVFNGDVKIISFDTLTTSVTVQDIYSKWVEWVLVSDNSKYTLAMRNVGGDPLPSSKQLGLTYFLLNGWKIKPYEESHTLNIIGNLYSEDGSSPFISVLGNYNVSIISSVSNLIDTISVDGGGLTPQGIWDYPTRKLSNDGVTDIKNGIATSEELNKVKNNTNLIPALL